MEYPIVRPRETGIKIKEKVREKGYTTRDVMEFMGFRNPKSVYAWYRGDALPSLENMMALSVLLEISVNELIVIKE